jgi:hypothetical protein
VVSVHGWKQAQEVAAALRTGAQEGGSLLRILAAARRLGRTVTAVGSSETYTVVCRIGGRKVVLPTPIPDVVVQQVIADMEKPT